MSVRAMLEPALVGGDTWDDVERQLRANVAQLWIGDRCAMVTQLFSDHTAHIWLAGGRLAGLLDLMPRCIETARYWGVQRITINGRRGWRRVLDRYGFRPSGALLEMTL